jgi:hypothetical protein
MTEDWRNGMGCIERVSRGSFVITSVDPRRLTVGIEGWLPRECHDDDYAFFGTDRTVEPTWPLWTEPAPMPPAYPRRTRLRARIVLH